MATPSSDGNSAEPEKPPSTAYDIVPAPIARNDQRVCFICLQTDADEPDATWVNPCPCSLEAHERCMLRWVAEMETSAGRSKDGLQCPACKAPITVEEPYDAFLALKDGLYQRYSRLSPYILLALVSSGGIAGAAGYGWGAASVFAGHDAVERWYFADGSHHRVRLTMQKVCALACIGPYLVLARWFPSVTSVLLLPITVSYSAVKLAQNQIPTWPPSPEWVITFMPALQISYNYLLYILFGPLSKRLNRALRGQQGDENEAAAGGGAAPAPADRQPVVGEVVIRNGERADGFWGMLVDLGRAALGLLIDFPEGGALNVEVEIAHDIEVRIGGADEEEEEEGEEGQEDDEHHDDDDDDMMMPQADGGRVREIEGEEEDEFQVLAEGAAGQRGQEEQEEPHEQAAAEEPARQQHQQQQQQQQPHQPAPNEPNNQNGQRRNVNNNNIDNNHNHNDNNNNNNNNGEAAPDGFPVLTLLINGMTSALLTPVVCYGMGELIRLARPRSRPPAGLLQERWGRSLAGGLLYVVLRDMMKLYAKYRRVQVRTRRRVRNVEKRPGRETATTGAGGQ